jgi:Lrp/AsnC family transcriptional regulator for asnA, asnC and gidA
MAQFPETSYVAVTAGRFDIIVEVVCRDTAHFSHLLTGQMQLVPGVTKTESFLVLSIEKMAYGWDVRKNVGGSPAPAA